MDPNKKQGKQLKKLVSMQQRKWQPGLQDSWSFASFCLAVNHLNTAVMVL